MAGTNDFVEMFVLAVIAVALYAPLKSYTDEAAANSSGVEATLITLVPTLYIIVLIAVFAYMLKHKGK